MLETQIKENIQNPEALESIYQKNKKAFASTFNAIYSTIETYDLAKFWNVRLNSDKLLYNSDISPKKNLIFLIISSIITAFLLHLNSIIPMVKADIYDIKNISIIVFFGLSAYTIMKNKYRVTKNIILSLILFIIPTIYVNLLYYPILNPADSVSLAIYHLIPLIWFVFMLVYLDFDIKNKMKITEFIKYNGDLLIISTLFIIAFMVLSIITIMLFQAINIKIETFYMKYIVKTAAVVIPILATYFITIYPRMLNKIVPLIAKFFSPIVLITLIIFFSMLPFSEKNLYTDRNFLMIFNIVLLTVLAIIIFSVTSTPKDNTNKFTNITLLLLTFFAIVVDSVALSAIFYRLNEYGFSPNKTAVLGLNIIVLGHLIYLLFVLFKFNFKKSALERVEKAIVSYLPVYLVWLIIVVFAFPYIFWFK